MCSWSPRFSVCCGRVFASPSRQPEGWTPTTAVKRRKAMTMGILVTALLTAPMIACGADTGAAGDSLPPKTIVFFGGCKTHAPGAHEHLRGAQLLKRC